MFINIQKSYEGLESSEITINNGNIKIASNDDGMNVVGEGGDMFFNPRQTVQGFSESVVSTNNKLVVNGGYIAVDALGDGLDIGGSIYMTNGTVVISGPTANDNGALDYIGVCEIDGGILVAAGSYGMAQATSTQSSQPSIHVTYSSTIKAGTLIHLEDSSGESIITFAPAKDYQSVVISSPDLKIGKEYVLYSGGSSTGTQTDGFYEGGKYTPGTKIANFKISSVVTKLR